MKQVTHLHEVPRLRIYGALHSTDVFMVWCLTYKYSFAFTFTS